MAPSTPDRPVPKVSVAMIIYNHEQYVAQALEGVLLQQTDFPVEVVVGEDCSIDATRAIVRDFQRRYPDRIRLIAHEGNVGAQRNLEATIAACTGTYVAFLEGDDYWTSPHKLQRQVDFLDRHPEYSLCFHNVAMLYTDGYTGRRAFCPEDQQETSTITDLLSGNFVPTCSKMFRRVLFRGLPEWTHRLLGADWSCNVLLAEHGGIGYINEIMATYRVHPGGVWTGASRRLQLQDVIGFYESVNAHLGFRYDRIIRGRLGDTYRDLAFEYAAGGDVAGACVSAVNAWRLYAADPDAPRVSRVGRLADGSGAALRRIGASLLHKTAPAVRAVAGRRLGRR